MIERLSLIVGWLLLALIVFVTLSPVQQRPVLASLQVEHFVAFGVMGVAFALGAPRRMLLVASMMIASAFLLEGLQLLTPDRHARVLDAAMKAAGGVFGVIVAWLVASWLNLIEDRIAQRVGRHF